MEENKVNIHFQNESVAKLFTKEEVSEIFTNLSDIFGKSVLKVFRKNGENLNEYEFLKLFYLYTAFKHIRDCKGFDLHIREYTNNFNTSFFVSLIADVLVAHQLEVELEPDIPNHTKKPDLYAYKKGVGVYFEGKQPQDPSQEELFKEQEYMFKELMPILDNNFSLALFYKDALSFEELETIKTELNKRLQHVVAAGEIYSNEGLNCSVHITLATDPIDDTREIKLLGIPTFNKGYCYANAINSYGKNMIFYKAATPFNRVVAEQLRKSRKKVPRGNPYIVIIDASSVRYDINDIELFINKRFMENNSYEEDISGVILTDFRIDPNFLIGLEMRYISNPNAHVNMEWLGKIFNSSLHLSQRLLKK